MQHRVDTLENGVFFKASQKFQIVAGGKLCDFALIQIVVRTEERFERSVVGGTGLGGLRVDFIIGREGFAAILTCAE